MEQIKVMTGVRYKPEHLIDNFSKKKKYRHLVLHHVSTVYSPCWIFEFRVCLKASKNASRYAGYYAGVDEINMTPGKLQLLPAAEEMKVEDYTLLKCKLNQEKAVELAWDYNKSWITIKYKNLYAPPLLEDYKLHFYYKILYIIEFYNQNLEEKKYMLLDSLTGDLEQIEFENK